jgi:hypothetical protein
VLVALMRAVIPGVVALVLSSVLILSMFPPLELIDYVFWVLSTNFSVAPEVFIMFSAMLLLLAGGLLAYSVRVLLSVGAMLSESLAYLCSWFGSLNGLLNRRGAPALVAAALLIVYWHMPPVLDAALLQFRMHLIMNTSLLLAGVLIFVGGGCLSGTMRKVVAIVAHMAMGIFGVYLLVTSGYNHFYAIYPLDEQAQLGLVMVIMMFLVDGLLVPYWLYRYFSEPIPPVSVAH